MIDQALARRYVRALFRHDRRGHLTVVNEWDGGPTPRFFVMRTRSGSVRRFRYDVSDDLVRRVMALEGVGADLDPVPRRVERYLELFDAPEFRAGPAFMFPPELPAAPTVVEIDHTNADLLRGGFEAWLSDIGRRGPFVAIVGDGRAVSLCASVRITRHVHCAGVETLPAHRGRGHAARVVAAWATRVRALGAVPFYGTTWRNDASRGVARRLGLDLAGVEFQIA
jgi:RimJ/RimL family protein N-acetyltransferase